MAGKELRGASDGLLADLSAEALAQVEALANAGRLTPDIRRRT